EKEDALINDYNEGLITMKELNRLRIDEWLKTTEQIQEDVWNLAQDGRAQNLIELDQSGAVQVSAWVKQISGVRGAVSNMNGDIINLPLAGNFEKGLNNFEYFVASKAVRKSFADVALKTSESGYLTRRLVDVSQDIITKIEDCGTTEGVVFAKTDKRQMSFENRIKGRFLTKDATDNKGKVIANAGDEITVKLAK